MLYRRIESAAFSVLCALATVRCVTFGWLLQVAVGKHVHSAKATGFPTT
jgi:hypothetical protein